MRLRYLHLLNYPPISDIKLCFASGSPLARECAIRFVVGVNGSGKSNLLRALAEVFLALADGRPIPFPVQLVYELGHRDSPSSRTLVLDGLEGRQSASRGSQKGMRFRTTPRQNSLNRHCSAFQLIPARFPQSFAH